MVNKYPGKCVCGNWVIAGAGEALKVNGKWVVQCKTHDGNTPVVTAPTAIAATNNKRLPNKFPGVCTCGKNVLANEGYIYKKDDKWAVGCSEHPNCKPAATTTTNERRLPEWLSKLVFSDLQQAIIAAVVAMVHDLQVVALAGCGKTTTILAAAAACWGKKVLVLAFGKAIADECAEKAKELLHVVVRTTHSLGYQMLRLAYKVVKFEPDKTFQMIQVHVQHMTPADRRENIPVILKLVGLCKNTMTDPTMDNLEDLALEYEVTLNGHFAEIAYIVQQILKDSIPAANANEITIDHDDMIWLPNVLNLRAPRFDYIFADEAQDLNIAQQQLIMKVAQKAKLCYVGDPNQAIFHFRGADADGMGNFAAGLEKMGRQVITLPLNETRRCPKAIVELAQEIVPDFKALPEAPEGSIVNSKELLAKPGDMVVCRVNAPLVPWAYRLLRQGIPAKVNGRNIGDGLVKLIKSLKATTIENLIDKLVTYRDNETNKITKKYAAKPSKQQAAQEALDDKCDTLEALAYDQETVGELITAITNLFDDVKKSNTDMVLLSTIHRAKGLEANTVHYLQTKPLKGRQEDNLRYVAITRAKDTLVMVHEQTDNHS